MKLFQRLPEVTSILLRVVETEEDEKIQFYYLLTLLN